MKVNRLFKSRKGIPVVMQSHISECGLACLSMILGYYGYLTGIASIRRRAPLSSRGATLYDIKLLAETYGLTSQGIQADWDDLKKTKTPAMIQWSGKHFVVLRNIKGDKAIILDPARGVCAVTKEEFTKRASEVVLTFTPNRNFEPGGEIRKPRLRDIIPLNRFLITNLGQIFVASLIMEGIALVIPMFFQFGIDHIAISGNLDLLGIVAVAFIFLVLFNFFIDIARGRIVIYLKAHMNLEMDSKVYKKLLSLPQNYFDNRQSGDTLSRFYSLRTIQDTLSGSFVEAILDGFMVLGTLLLMAIYSLSLTGIVFALYATYLLVRGLWYQKFRDANEMRMITLARRQTELVESVQGIQAIKIFQKEKNRILRWIERVSASVNADARVGLLTLIYKGSSDLIVGLSNILVIWFGIFAILKGNFTIGMLVAFIAFKGQFFSKGALLLDRIIDYVTLQVHIARVTDIVSEESENISEPKGPGISPKDNSLELHSVSYRYGKFLPYVLEGISFRIEDGECLAIKGPSGIGKSTLAKLMLGLLLPEEGELRIGNQPYIHLGISRVRDMIGAVMQDDIVFDGSILENITFFNDKPEYDWAIECAKFAQIHDDISAMPMGYDTLMGNMGSALSGGQKQRVLIARALYKRPRLLMMDEATSHLDHMNEDAVGKAIGSLPLTRIVFAHRESTLRLADRVIDLSDVIKKTKPKNSA